MDVVKSKIKLILMLALAIVIDIYLFWLTFKFNPKFFSTQKPLYVGDYIKNNGHIYLIIGLVLVLIFSISLLVHAYYDSKNTLVFKNEGQVEFYQKENFYSFKRIVQYYTIITAIYTLIRSIVRAINLDFSYPAVFIFKTDILFVMLDMVLLFFIITTALLVVETVTNLKAADA